MDRVVGGRRGLASRAEGIELDLSEGGRALVWDKTRVGWRRIGLAVAAGFAAGGGECWTGIKSSPGSIYWQRYW